jgi:TonB-linked SusC/RagA family outer membrane protein
MENRTVTDAAQALQGKAAGVQISNISGAPGQTASIQIRGYSSNARTEPLYIVDGLKVQNLNYLDPDNVESIEILKDGASAAIYGIEAGNGVILVTTKTGTSSTGQGRVFYNMQQTSQKISNLPKVLNAEQYINYLLTSGAATSIDDFDYDGVTDTYWADHMFETGQMSRHTIGFEGGNDRGSFYVSLGKISSDGIVASNKDVYDRLTGQINADYKIKDWLQVGITSSLEKTETEGVTEGRGGGMSTIGAVMVYDPITPWVYEKGKEPARIQQWLNQDRALPADKNGNVYGSSVFAANSNIWHPAVMRDRADTETKSFNARGTAFLNITPIKGLTLTSRLGYRVGYFQTSTYNYELFINATANQSMSINGRSSNNLYYQWENFGSYLFDIGNHEFNVMAGMSYQRSENDFIYGSANLLTYDDPNLRYLDNTLNSSTMSLDGIPGENNNMSYFGRLGWTLNSKYDIQTSFRADAYDTSKLDKDHRWGYFPSISGGWTISNESFMDNIKSKLDMSSLRLHVSYGILGNVNALGNYQYNTSLSPDIEYGYDPGNGQIVGVFPADRLSNPNVKWETTRQLNIGFGARFLRDRLTLNLDVYNKNTNDLLTSTTAPANTGYQRVYVNAGTVNNRGLEIELGWRDEIGDFGYSINGNIAFLKNEVTKGISKDRVDGSSISNAGVVTYFEEGFPIWYLRTYILEKIDPETGLAIYKDISGPDGKPDGIINADDREMAGSGIPDYTYGLTVNLNYKNFDLTIYGNGAQGVERLFALGRGDFPYGNTLLEFYENRWTPENRNSKYPKPNYEDLFYKLSDAQVFDASFFKIKQIQFGYNVPSSLLRKAGISRLRAYVSLDDWFTFTKYPGLDPETSGMGGNISALGLDNGNYPISRKVVFGLNVSF